MSEVEKSVAEQLKELLDAAVAEKANTADLEGLASEAALEEKADKADLEGVVKTEQLEEVKGATASIVAEAVEAAKAEVREEMEAKMAEAPAVHTAPRVITPSEFMKHVQEDGTESFRKTIQLSKAAVAADQGFDTEQVDGGREDFAPTWRKLQLLNPFRPYVTMMQASGGVITLPEVDGIYFTEEGNSHGRFGSASNVNDLGGNAISTTGAFSARRNQGQLGSTQIVIKNFVTQSAFSKPALEDVPALREQIAAMIVEAYAKAQAWNCLDLITGADEDNSNLPNWGKGGVTYGDSSDDFSTLDATTVVETLAALIEEVDPQYRVGGRFHVSSKILSLLNQANLASSAGYSFDPVTNTNRLFGYEIVLNGYLSDTTDNAGSNSQHVNAIFGNMDRSIVLAERRGLVIDEYPQAAPGFNTYFADGRFNHGEWDMNGMACLFSRTA